jgi:hypothetical protein
VEQAAVAGTARPAGPSAQLGELEGALRALDSWGSSRDWRGPDPYEGLNARRLEALRRTALGRRILIQAVKRSPVDLRRPLGIPPLHNAAAVANVLSAYSRPGFIPEEERRRKLDRSVELLEGLVLDAFEQPSWGYHFDVETRVFFYPRTMPNTIATAFAGLALLDAYENTGVARLLELAVGAGEFFLAHVPQTEARGGAYFGYLAGDRSPIHNSSVLVCALLARLLRHTPRQDFAEAAAAGVGYCLAHQRPDGSWPYGERPNLQWVDGFHTGYVLDALAACSEAGVDPALSAALERGLRFYERELFLRDGTPKYYPSRVLPIDSQCVAQGIQTLAMAHRVDDRYLPRAWQVFAWARDNMRRPDGAYLFQRRRFWRNSTPHVRWAQAPMFAAMANLWAAESRATS